jgi:predicted DNA repair protein MutK
MKMIVISLALLADACVPLAAIPPLLITGGAAMQDVSEKLSR